MACSVAFGLHWLRYSVARPVAEVRDTIGGGWSDGLPGGAFNQPRQLIHESGARLYYGSPREDQPLVLEVSGEVCETHAADFVAHGERLGGRCTRFDVAADIGPDDLTKRRWLQMRRDFRAGRCDTRMPRQSFTQIMSDKPGDGWTAYYGSTASEVMLRAYTRRGPLRLEWQVKPSTPAARLSWATALTQFTPGEVWRTFGRRCEWPAAWYMTLLDGRAATVPMLNDPDRTLTKLLDSLRVQIGPTLWVLQQAGVPLEDLTREPRNPDGKWLAEVRRLAADATALGFNGANLQQQAERIAKKRDRSGRKASSAPTPA